MVKKWDQVDYVPTSRVVWIIVGVLAILTRVISVSIPVERDRDGVDGRWITLDALSSARS